MRELFIGFKVDIEIMLNKMKILSRILAFSFLLLFFIYKSIPSDASLLLTYSRAVRESFLESKWPGFKFLEWRFDMKILQLWQPLIFYLVS